MKGVAEVIMELFEQASLNQSRRGSIDAWLALGGCQPNILTER